MLTLNDGRSELWQWDTGRTLAVDADCSQVHFSNKVFGRSVDVDVVDGAAIIPDILLQTDKDLNVWAFVGTAENGYTKISKTFQVNRRNKPADYVFTPVEQTTLAELSGRLDRIEESQDPDAIKNAVDDYLKQNPVEIPVQSVNGQTGAVELTADDVGAIAETELPTAINTALAQAKASGEFDGPQGPAGPKGDTGDTGPQGIQGPAGPQGETGPEGPQGVQGPQGERGIQGETGPAGADGAAGQDGHSPVVTATKSGKTTTISVDGSAIATVEDGADGKPGAAGQAGANGADGKSAYQYAVEGGYTGTEEEFAEKLAEEQLTGTTNELTPTQVYNAVSAGIPVKVQYTDSTYGLLSFTAFNIAESLSMIVAQAIVYYGGVYILAELGGNIQAGNWFHKFTVLAEKADIPTIPTALKNPNALTIKIGSTTVTYDGSSAETVEIADGSEVSY